MPVGNSFFLHRKKTILNLFFFFFERLVFFFTVNSEIFSSPWQSWSADWLISSGWLLLPSTTPTSSSSSSQRKQKTREKIKHFFFLVKEKDKKSSRQFRRIPPISVVCFFSFMSSIIWSNSHFFRSWRASITPQTVCCLFGPIFQVQCLLPSIPKLRGAGKINIFGKKEREREKKAFFSLFSAQSEQGV